MYVRANVFSRNSQSNDTCDILFADKDQPQHVLQLHRDNSTLDSEAQVVTFLKSQNAAVSRFVDRIPHCCHLQPSCTSSASSAPPSV